MEVMYGQPVADSTLNYIAGLVALNGITPELCLDDTDTIYGRGIRKDVAKCGIRIVERITTNTDGMVSLTGGFVPWNLNMDGDNTTPCTAEAIVKILKHYGVTIAGHNVVIVGRSERVGRPLAKMLLDMDATVTVCHSKTYNLWNRTVDGDILVSCTGVPSIITGFMIKPGAVVVDVGAPLPDVNLSSSPELKALVPSKGGVGPVTRAVLMEHVVNATLNRRTK